MFLKRLATLLVVITLGVVLPAAPQRAGAGSPGPARYGTGFTENGLIVDGRLSKIGNELEWDYDWDNPMRPWRVRDPDGQLDATLTPRYDKHSKAQGHKRSSETHQVFGTWSGSLRTDDGVALDFDGLQGFAEEARQNW